MRPARGAAVGFELVVPGRQSIGARREPNLEKLLGALESVAPI
jgi:hypothetical protein